MLKYLASLLIITVSACGHPGGRDAQGGHTERATDTYHCHTEACTDNLLAANTPVINSGDSSELKITSFNIQFLGNPKSRDNKALASILSDSDIVVIQELVAPPISGTYPDGTTYTGDAEALAFFTEMEALGFDYALSSEDTGTGDRIHLKSSATEWWVAFYKSGSIQIAYDLLQLGVGGFLATDRSNHDAYERVPYAFPFRHTGSGADFVLISVHLKPGSGPANRQRRQQELENIYGWIKNHEETEKDHIILGDMNLYSCDILQTMDIGTFKTLNSECLNTNTNTNGPEPYDHVLYRPLNTPEIDLDYGFTVTDLIAEMRSIWTPTSNEIYPGTPYSHNKFRARYSDHHPVSFQYKTLGDDD